MEGNPQETNKKDVGKKSFNISGLSEPNQDFFEEILESSHGSPTKAIDRICKLARQNVEKAAAESETLMIPPNCGWAMFDEEEGDVCLFGLKKPVRRSLLKWRKLKFFRCDMCELVELKRQEQQLLEKQTVKASLPVVISKYTSYKARRDIMLIAQKYETTSPTEIARLVKEIKGESISPDSVSAWFRRHPEETAELEAYIERRKAMTPEEKQQVAERLKEMTKKQFQVVQSE